MNFRKNSKRSSTPHPLIFVKLCCKFFIGIWSNICKEVRGPDSIKCMHMISRDRDHSEGRGLGVSGPLEPFWKFISLVPWTPLPPPPPPFGTFPKIHPIWYIHPCLRQSWIISLFLIHLISHAQYIWCSLLHPFNRFFHQRCVMSGHHHYALEERKDVIISNSKAFASNWLPWGTCRKVLQNCKLTVNLI